VLKRLQPRQQIILLVGIPVFSSLVLAGALLENLHGSTHASGADLTGTVLSVASMVVLSALLAAGVGWTLHQRIEGLKREVERRNQEPAQGLAKAAPAASKKARGRRDAFNEILLGLEERARQVQADRDNLEQLVEQRTLALQRRNEAMRLVLDNVDQGLATIGLNGQLSMERSRRFDEWFGPGATPDARFEQQLAKLDEKAQTRLRMGWEQVVDGLLPLEVSLNQMPSSLKVAGRHYALEYKPIFEQEQLHGVLLVTTDLTEHTQQMQRDVEQREFIQVFERFVRDRSGFVEFLRECDSLVSSALAWQSMPSAQLLRVVHTLKGNCAVFGVASVAEVAHELETSIAADGAPDPEQLATLSAAWRVLSERVRRLDANSGQHIVEVLPDEFQELADAIRDRLPHAQLAVLTDRLRHEPVRHRLQRAADQAKTLAARLGKAQLRVEVNAGTGLRSPSERWAPFWAGFVHVVRNAVDHGVEGVEERRLAGKADSGTLTFSARTDADCFIVELSDDGRGIEWDRVRLRAEARGLPHASESDLIEALFVDGMSTANSVSEVSGRGVGMSAVREAAQALGGRVQVCSRAGKGTTLTFVFPLSSLAAPS
jgi:two-component system chemotaxis sensor kinase CheA